MYKIETNGGVAAVEISPIKKKPSVLYRNERTGALRESQELAEPNFCRLKSAKM